MRRLVLLLSLAVTGCRAQIMHSDQTPVVRSLQIVADRAATPLLRELVNKYQAQTGLVLDWNIRSGDSTAVMHWLETGEASFGMSSFMPDNLLGKWWVAPVGQDALAIIANVENPVQTISPATLRRLFQGQYKTWAALSDAKRPLPDWPITLVTRADSSGTTQLLMQVMGDSRIARSAALGLTDADVLAQVASDRGAVGYVAMSYLSALPNEVKPLLLDGIPLTVQSVTEGHYPLRTPTLLIGKYPPQDDDYRRFFAWIQASAGQAVVRQFIAGIAQPSPTPQ